MQFDVVLQLHRTRPAARHLLASLLEDSAEEGRTTVDELIDDGAISRRQAISLLRDLAEAGCGEFKVGRKGHPSRLEWIVDPRELAARVLGGETDDETGEVLPVEDDPELEPDDDDDDDTDDDDAAPSQGALALGDMPEPTPSANEPPAARRRRSNNPTPAAGELIEHVHVLRPNFRVHLQLPADLSPREAEVLADWLRNLSFERL